MSYRINWVMVLLIVLFVYANFGVVAQAGSENDVSLQGGWLMASAQDSHIQISGATNGTIIVIGASYAAGLNLETIAGRKVINKGIGGEQSFETLARFDQEVIAVKPDAVILWGFINDIFRSDREQVNSGVERIKSSYIAMIDKAREQGITPIVATEITMSMRPGLKETVMTWVGKLLNKSSYQDYINGHVMAVNQWLKIYAAENDVVLLDFQSLLADDDGIMRKKEYAQEDGSHISKKAYGIIAKYIQENVKTIE